MIFSSGEGVSCSPSDFMANVGRASREVLREQYEKKHGLHFSASLADYAVSRLSPISGGVRSFTRERLREHLHALGLQEPHHFEDFFFLANQVLSDYYPEAIKTEADVVRGAYRYMADDPDGYDGALFRRFLLDAQERGDEVDWPKFT
jgi:hypothetical protein